MQHLSTAYVNTTNSPSSTSHLDETINPEMVKINEGLNIQSVEMTKMKIQINCYLTEHTTLYSLEWLL